MICLKLVAEIVRRMHSLLSLLRFVLIRVPRRDRIMLMRANLELKQAAD